MRPRLSDHCSGNGLVPVPQRQSIVDWRAGGLCVRSGVSPAASIHRRLASWRSLSTVWCQSSSVSPSSVGELEISVYGLVSVMFCGIPTTYYMRHKKLQNTRLALLEYTNRHGSFLLVHFAYYCLAHESSVQVGYSLINRKSKQKISERG